MPVPEFLFHASCDHHDFNYWLGYRRKDRLKADRQFYREMRRDAGASLVYQSLALTYYLAVRTFGGGYFHYGERERDERDLEKIIARARPHAGENSGPLLPNSDSVSGDEQHY